MLVVNEVRTMTVTQEFIKLTHVSFSMCVIHNRDRVKNQELQMLFVKQLVPTILAISSKPPQRYIQ